MKGMEDCQIGFLFDFHIVFELRNSQFFLKGNFKRWRIFSGIFFSSSKVQVNLQIRDKINKHIEM